MNSSKAQLFNNIPTRYHATVELNLEIIGRDAGKVAEEVLCHLVGLVGSKVKVTLDIEAQVTEGVSDHVVRVVTEKGRTLGFKNQGFEKEFN